jgi:phosphonate transport system ATP-binding protein
MPASHEALGQVGLSHLALQRAGTLSGGQAQRVSIARALMQRPSVLLADEPVASLDPEAATDIMRLLQRLAHRDGLGVLCVLHQVDLAFAFADRVVGMRAGAAIFDRSTAGVTPREVQDLYQKRAA